MVFKKTKHLAHPQSKAPWVITTKLPTIPLHKVVHLERSHKALQNQIQKKHKLFRIKNV